MPTKMTIEEFIRKGNEIHNNEYSYEKSKYNGNKIKILITCELHGDFLQLPYNHLMGKGCQICGGNKKNTKESFISKSNTKHNNLYRYDLVDFINSKSKVKIICKIHGTFEQSPEKHINGSGCQYCGGTIKSTNKEFIEKANKIHNFKYDYSKVDYLGNKIDIEIVCKIHGSFNQSPSNHLKGVGCPKCSGKAKPTNEEFIEKYNKIHNHLYKYDNVNYINCKTEVEIECSKHGIFKQVPNYHLSGRGCQKCRNSNGELKIESFLKKNSINYISQFSFSDLKDKKELKFDFAIFGINNDLKYLIEYNGEQHYNYRGQFGMSEKQFIESENRDKLKMDYCNKNKINIFIIKYDEDIDLKMSKIIEEKIENLFEFSANPQV